MLCKPTWHSVFAGDYRDVPCKKPVQNSKAEAILLQGLWVNWVQLSLAPSSGVGEGGGQVCSLVLILELRLQGRQQLGRLSSWGMEEAQVQ